MQLRRVRRRAGAEGELEAAKGGRRRAHSSARGASRGSAGRTPRGHNHGGGVALTASFGN
jgi:hypothetical protein